MPCGELLLSLLGMLVQAPSLAVERRGPPRLDVNPDDVVTVPFRITNTGRLNVVAELAVVLPRGWPATPTPPLELSAGGSDLQLVGVAVPRNAPAGRYVVRLRAHQASDSVIVIVRERRQIEVIGRETPSFVVAGEPYTARFTIVNRGNATAPVRLGARSSLGLPTRLDSAAFVLPVGGQRVVAVLVATERTIRRQTRDLLELRATGPSGSPETVLASALVEIIPRGGERGRRFETFPVTVGLRVTDAGSFEAPARLAGSGPLTPGGRTHLDFLFRRARASTLMSEHDEYRLTLRGAGFDIRLGDHFYALSPLTESGRAGFGGGGTLALGRWTGGAFLRWDRRNFDADSLVGAFLGLRFAPAARAQVNYLRIRAGEQGEVWSVRTQVEPARAATVDLEYALGRGALGRGTAYRVGISGTLPIISYDLRHVRVDRTYPLRERELPADAASVTLRPWGAWRLEAAWNAASRELLVLGTPLGTPAPAILRTRYARAGLGYRSAFLVEYKRTEFEIEGAEPGPSQESRSVGLRFAPRMGRIVLSPAGEAGIGEDRRTGERAAFRRVALGASVSVRAGDWISATIEHVGGGPSALRSRGPISAAVNASVQLTPVTRLRVSTSRTLYAEAWVGAYRGVDATLEQTLPLGHRLITRYRAFSSRGAPQALPPAFQVEYEIPLRVPVARVKESGTVIGRIFDAETGRALTDVPVRVGDQVIMSDHRGRMRFSGLKPGRYDLQFDQRAVQSGRVPSQGAARVVVVEEGGTARFAVGFVAASRLRGRVMLLERPAGERADSAAAGTPPAGGTALPNVVLELSAPGEAHRRVSDEMGRFDFSALPPGRWRLMPAPGALPPHHVWEHDTLVIELGPGAEREIQLTVIPTIRPVRLVAEADLTPLRVDSAAVKPAPPAATPAPSGPPHLYMTSHQDHTLADVARRVYGDGSLWPKLWVANRSRLRTPDRLPTGVVLTIPPPGALTDEERAAGRAFPSIR